VLLCVLAPAFGALRPAGPQQTSGGLKTYSTQYYVFRTDLDTDDTKEAIIRMTKMVEEYHNRTSEFSGTIREKLPFTLFKDREDYYAAGGLPGSAGVFTGRALLAIAGEHTDARTWHVVQHEGFHQFAAAVIRGELPTWLNEGIAEYFGESIFTGDGFVSGIVPSWRLKRIQEQIKTNQFKTIRQIMLIPQSEWNSRLSSANYDQAWSMVHFLAHGANGRYQQPFVNFMKAIGRGVPWPNAWKQTFGDASGFEQQWREYWLNLPEDPTADLYAQATAAKLNSFLARAAAQKQRFDNFDEFLTVASNGKVKTGETIEDWLPPKLLEESVTWVKHSDAVKWSLTDGDKSPQIVATLPNDVRIIGLSAIRGGHVLRTWVELDDTGAVVKQASALIESGKRDDARLILQRALKAHPKSPAADEARKLIGNTAK
jgi:hypothetical protein